MSRTVRGFVVVIACLLVVGLCSPAVVGSAGASDDDALGDDTVIGDTLTDTTDTDDGDSTLDSTVDVTTTDDSTVNVSVGENTSADAEVDATDGTKVNATTDVTDGTNGTNVTATVDATNGSLDADASANASLSGDSSTLSTSGDVDATLSTSGASVTLDTDLSADASLAGSNVSLAQSLGVAGGAQGDDAATATPTASDPADGADSMAAADADESADTPGGDGDGSIPTPSGSTVAIGLVVVGGAAAAGRGASLIGANPVPVDVRTGTRVAAHWLRAELPKIVPFGYSRHDDSDPLEHDARAAIYETIETTPGVNLTALAESADVSLSSVRHHLRILEAEGLIETTRINGKRRYFPLGTEDHALVAALDDPAKAAVLRAVAAAEPASVSDLADTLDRDASTVSHHLSDLEAAGLVERERAGRSVETRLAPEVRPVFAADADSASALTAD